jgi:hypothetical protein
MRRKPPTAQRVIHDDVPPEQFKPYAEVFAREVIPAFH